MLNAKKFRKGKHFMQNEFRERRESLRSMLDEESIAIIPNSFEKVRNRDVSYQFRSDSDFYYLTGFEEPESLAVFIPHRPQGEYILFCRENDSHAETWHGRRVGLTGACSVYGADDSFPYEDLDEILPGLMENKKRIYYPMGRYREFDKKIMNWVTHVGSMGRAGIHAPDQFLSLGQIIHEMRLIKTPNEVKSIEKAIEISIAGHLAAMKKVKPRIKEYQLEAEIIKEFMKGGSRYPAYPSIVGSGRNACILHYTENKDFVEDGDLVLIDAGAELNFYAADITRTFPANGKFSESQKIIYEIVLKAQLAAIDEVKAGNSWNDPHLAAVRVITSGLKDIGILKGPVDELIDREAYMPYFMHKTGHWLGIDVHDVGDYKINGEWRNFQPGMITTVEPGIYISGDDKTVEDRWKNIGVRIEDDVLVTERGNRVLSATLPKTVQGIESIIGIDGS